MANQIRDQAAMGALFRAEFQNPIKSGPTYEHSEPIYTYWSNRNILARHHSKSPNPPPPTKDQVIEPRIPTVPRDPAFFQIVAPNCIRVIKHPDLSKNDLVFNIHNRRPKQVFYSINREMPGK